MLAAGLLLVACGPQGPPEPGLRIRIAPTPPTVGTARVVVQVLETSSRPVSGFVSGRPLSVDTPDPPESAVESGPNALSVPDFDFHTPGPWRLVAEVTLADGSLLRDSTDATVVKPLANP